VKQYRTSKGKGRAIEPTRPPTPPPDIGELARRAALFARMEVYHSSKKQQDVTVTCRVKGHIVEKAVKKSQNAVAFAKHAKAIAVNTTQKNRLAAAENRLAQRDFMRFMQNIIVVVQNNGEIGEVPVPKCNPASFIQETETEKPDSEIGNGVGDLPERLGEPLQHPKSVSSPSSCEDPNMPESDSAEGYFPGYPEGYTPEKQDDATPRLSLEDPSGIRDSSPGQQGGV
jgi:hypothetical protein